MRFASNDCTLVHANSTELLIQLSQEYYFYTLQALTLVMFVEALKHLGNLKATRINPFHIN